MLVATGIWNLVEVDVTNASTRYQVTLLVKLGVVALSGVSAALHTRSASRIALATWGAISGLTAIAALVLGVQLHG